MPNLKFHTLTNKFVLSTYMFYLFFSYFSDNRESESSSIDDFDVYHEEEANSENGVYLFHFMIIIYLFANYTLPKNDIPH